MAIQGVIFDLGHTLMYLDSTWPEVFARGAANLAAFIHQAVPALDANSFAQTLLEHREEGYARAKETMREVTADESMRLTFSQFGIHDPDPDLVAGAIDAYFDFEDSHWLACPGAVDVLRELDAQGKRLGLYSNATGDRSIQHLVDRLGFRPWIDPVLSSAGTGIRKPDPAAFTPILEAWGLPAASVAMVGDTLEADILGAQRAGMRSVWIRSRQDARQEGASESPEQPANIVPDRVISQLVELPGCLVDL